MGSQDDDNDIEEGDTRILAATCSESKVPLTADGTLPAGTRIRDYVIAATRAFGGFGTVYTADHLLLGRRVAIKVLHSDLCASLDARERFLREARAVNLIGHPNIVEIYDFGSLPDGRPYQVMEFLDGEDLHEYIVRRGRLDGPEILAIFEPLCGALQAAHDRGIVHRDIKARNIMLKADTGLEWVKLLDFGVAKLLHGQANGWRTSRGRIIGTPHTMAPEQILGGEIEPRTDVYALGAVLFRLLTGRYPFDAAELEILDQHLHTAPPPPSRVAPVSSPLDAVVVRAMAKEPDARFASAQAFLTALRRAMDEPMSCASKSYPAVAIYARVRISADGDIDDDVLDRVGELLDTVEEHLLAAGFAVPLQTHSSVLGVRVLGDGDLAQSHRRAIAHAEAIAARTSQLVNSSLHLSLCLDHGPVQGRITGTGIELTGGALTDPRSWPQPRYDARIYVTTNIITSPDETRVTILGHTPPRESGS